MLSMKQSAFIRALEVQHPYLMRVKNLSTPTVRSEVSPFIETVKIEALNLYGNRAGSMRAIIADRILHSWDDPTLMTLLGKEIGYGEYTRRIEFSSNPGGGQRRVPKPIEVQREELAKLIADLRAMLSRRGVEIIETETEEETEEISDEEETETNVKITGEVHPFLAKIRDIRREETRRSDVEGKRTPILEAVSGNRPAKNGAKMLSQGIPTDALLHALALDWPQEARSRYGIRDYDVSRYINGDVPENRHPAYAYFSACAKARVPIALIGPSGTGKSTLCKQWADDHGKAFGFVPMTAGATPSWIVGAYTLDGYRTRSAMDCYQNGGVFVFEEMDAADPNMLLVANNLIENEVFDNPVTGESIQRHPDFIPVACMNTRGLGATATNTGRSRLDDATRNRFALGRMELFLSEELETHIFESHYTA